MGRFKYLSIAVLLLLVVSCGKYKEITVGDFQEYKVKGFAESALLISIQVPVINPSLHKITISDFDARMYINEQYIGRVSLDRAIVLNRKSDEIHDLELKVRMANFLTTAAKMMNLKKGSRIMLRLEGEFTARSMLMKKRVPVDEAREVVI